MTACRQAIPKTVQRTFALTEILRCRTELGLTRSRSAAREEPDLIWMELGSLTLHPYFTNTRKHNKEMNSTIPNDGETYVVATCV